MRSGIGLVHEDERTREALCRVLRGSGHSVEVLQEPLPWMLLSAGLPELILLSWTARLPVRDVVAELRAVRRSVVLLVTHARLREAIQLLDNGADDCIATPPLIEEELLARVGACMRRLSGTGAPVRLSVGPLVLDKAIHALHVHGREIELAPAEFRLLAFLLENPGRVFSRRQLLRGAWSKLSGVSERTVDVHVRRLRKALEPFGCERMLHTVRGFGYRFSFSGGTDRAQSATNADSRLRP